MSDETEKQAALAAYWAARTPADERIAYAWMMQIGLPEGLALDAEDDCQQAPPAFITGDWSVEYPPIAEQPSERRDVFPRQAMIG